MSEMSAEKKKEIEKYIIKSYFGGGKNVESLANGADVIKGTDDGCIPQLIVEVTCFGEYRVVVIEWNIYGDSRHNSFAMRICRDEDLQKDKRIEELEREVKALRAEKEVMDRHIQELKSHNVSLAETNAVLNNKLNTFDPLLKFRIAVSSFWKRNYETLSKLVGFSSVEEIQDYLINEAKCDTLHEAIDSTESWHQAYRDVKATNEKLADNVKSWRKATGYSTPEEYLADRINGAFQTPFDYTAAWQKATGFESPEKFLKWKTHIEEIMKAWKDRTGCKYPGEAGELLERWKTLTKCETPEAAATWITSYESACGRGNRLAESVEKLKEEVVSWKNVTGYSTPEGFLYAMTKDSDNVWRDSTECKTLVDIINGLDQEIDKWQKATGYNSPEDAKTFIKNLNDRLDGFIQTASCAERHLEHVLLWKPEQTGQEVE